MNKMILLVALCTGCAIQQRGPEVMEGNESSVIVNWYESTRGTNGALTVADQHCARYGRQAQFSGKPNDFQLAYNCVK